MSSFFFLQKIERDKERSRTQSDTNNKSRTIQVMHKIDVWILRKILRETETPTTAKPTDEKMAKLCMENRSETGVNGCHLES